MIRGKKRFTNQKSSNTGFYIYLCSYLYQCSLFIHWALSFHLISVYFSLKEFCRVRLVVTDFLGFNLFGNVVISPYS